MSVQLPHDDRGAGSEEPGDHGGRRVTPRRVLVLTNMWPTADNPQFGLFVQHQVSQLRRAGLGVDVLFVDGRHNRGAYLRAFGRLREAVGRGNYDLIHAHYVFSGLVASTQRRLPVVLTHHGIEVMQGWQSPLCWIVSRHVDGVIVTSERMRKRLGLPEARVVPCAVDTEVFRPQSQADARAQLSLPAEEQIVLFVGEDRPEKRLDLAEQAVSLLGGPRLRHVHSETHDRVALFMNAADALVLSSDNEGSPQVVKEALACNLPVVATDVGAVRDLIGRVAGCFIADSTPEDLAAMLRLALRAGRLEDGPGAIADLSPVNIGRRVLEVYERVLAADV